MPSPIRRPASVHYLHICFIMFMVYALNGFMLPYWPKWVESYTDDSQQIGFIFGFSMAVRAVATFFIGWAIARVDRVREGLALVAFLLMLGFAGLWWQDQQVLATLYASAFLCGLYYAMVPMVEHLSTQRAKALGWNYANIRLWGSFAFGAFNMVGSYLLLQVDLGLLPPALVATAFLVVVPAMLLRERPANKKDRLHKIDWRGIMAKFWPILAPSLLIQMSHSYYYSFSTITWESQGIGATWIGALWTIGVAAEIVFFLLCKRLLRFMSLSQIISLGALASAARWLVLAYSQQLPILMAAQSLHAFTFGAGFYAAMVFIMGHLSRQQAAITQTLYAMLLSLIGLGLPGVFLGYGYELLGTNTYVAMCVLAVAGLGAANLPPIKNAINAPMP